MSGGIKRGMNFLVKYLFYINELVEEIILRTFSPPHNVQLAGANLR